VAFQYWRVATVMNDGWLNNLNSWDEHFRIVNDLWYFEKTLIPTCHEYISWFLHTCLQVCGSCTSCLSISDWKTYVPVAPPQAQKADLSGLYIYADRNAQLIRFNDMLLPDHPCSLMFNFLEKKIGSKFVEVAEMGRLDQSSLSKVSRLHQVLCNIIYICM
jgi:hypothetical protein